MRNRPHRFQLAALFVLWMQAAMVMAQAQEMMGRSHPPLRPLPMAADRPLADGPGRFVDAARGDDAQAGTEQAPWRTINHALTQLGPGDTLYLRGGTYFESVMCAVAGEPDKPITLRSYPGELAVIDASLREFQETPGECWEPAPEGVEGEFRTVRSYRNIRDVAGLFGDSLVGLQTYWYVEDLRARNESWLKDPEGKFNPQPIYCGPGLWYDKRNGRIHVRLAHTRLEHDKVSNYRGETDPRRLPMIIAPFGARALFVDQALHVRFEDLVFRGGGHDTVVLHQGIDVGFDNVTIYAGAYGLRARGTGPLRMTNSAIRGSIPPWAFRQENSLRGAGPGHSTPFIVPPDQPAPRNIARLNTHAVLVTEGSYEFEIFYYPHNHDWEISHSAFSDGHDGVYLSGHDIRFHHNHVHHFQDDAVFLGAPSANFTDRIEVYQNLFQHVGMSFGGYTRGGPAGDLFIYRNICDQRAGVNWARPSEANPQAQVHSNLPLVLHGRELLGMESWYFYHNLFISPNKPRSLGYGYMINRNTPGNARWLLNNIFVYLDQYPIRGFGKNNTLASDIALDGNIHWCPDPDAQPPENFLEQVRLQERGDYSERYPHPWGTHSQVGDPRLVRFAAEERAVNDYRLQPGSLAVGAGVVLPAFLPDVQRSAGEAQPEVGPIPLGTDELHVGRFGEVNALVVAPLDQ